MKHTCCSRFGTWPARSDAEVSLALLLFAPLPPCSHAPPPHGCLAYPRFPHPRAAGNVRDGVGERSLLTRAKSRPARWGHTRGKPKGAFVYFVNGVYPEPKRRMERCRAVLPAPLTWDLRPVPTQSRASSRPAGCRPAVPCRLRRWLPLPRRAGARALRRGRTWYPDMLMLCLLITWYPDHLCHLPRGCHRACILEAWGGPSRTAGAPRPANPDGGDIQC